MENHELIWEVKINNKPAIIYKFWRLNKPFSNHEFYILRAIICRRKWCVFYVKPIKVNYINNKFLIQGLG